MPATIQKTINSSLGNSNWFMWKSEISPSICQNCKKLNGRIFSKNNLPEIPVHPNCKCKLVPVLKQSKDAQADAQEYAEMKKVTLSKNDMNALAENFAAIELANPNLDSAVIFTANNNIKNITSSISSEAKASAPTPKSSNANSKIEPVAVKFLTDKFSRYKEKFEKYKENIEKALTEYAQKNNLDTAPIEKANRETISQKEIKKPSNHCISFIAEYETFSAKPYRGQDSQNRTVGYGHVITKEDGSKYDNGISKDEALKLLAKDVQKATQQLNKFLKNNNISLSQNQYDSLISFTFNCGSSWMNESTLRSSLINGDMDKVKDGMMKWIYANGKKSNGLINRRIDEVEMFYDANYARDY